MAAHAGIIQRSQQTPSMSPEHIMGKAVLKMNLQDLQQFVQAQFAENPALAMDEESQCPACGCALIDGFCPACGSEVLSSVEERDYEDDAWQEGIRTPAPTDDEYYEPFATVAAPKSLAAYLQEQIGASLDGAERRIAELIVGYLDEDGYLREPLIDIANSCGISVPQLEDILGIVQALDPPGVAARDLRECLLLQLDRLDANSRLKALAAAVVRDHWDDLERMKLDRIAKSLKISPDAIADAIGFIRENTNPHPAGVFRDPWERLSPRQVSGVRPDVVIRSTEDGLLADIMDPVSGRVAVEEMYASLHEEISQQKKSHSEADRAHIKEAVSNARSLIDALEFRKSSLRRIIDELLICQAEFFANGPFALKPLTRKELAAKIGLHESTICRATQDKTIRLPGGEVIAFDVLFDAALPVKEMVRRLAVEKLSDGEIAQRLGEIGISIARRTVAKYRDQLRVLPVEYRVA
jgi:RNA polymerase sigma-54 factor